MYLIKRSKLTGDYSIQNNDNGFFIDAKCFNHGLNEFWIVKTKEEMEKITDKLEKEINEKERII